MNPITKKPITQLRRVGTRIALVAAFAVLGFASQGWAQSAKRFPAIEAYDLAGEVRRLPAGLPTALTLLIVAFDRDQQPQAERLSSLIDEAKAAARGIATIETPVIQDPGSAGRFFIDNGMKSGIRDADKRKAVVTLYVKDLTAWLAETDLMTKDTVYLMAVTRSGRIVRSARGETLADVGMMKSFVAQAQKQAGN
ncbi:MAG: hypothetical protein ACRCUE_12785 [Bosea sp. (in: a-proteobacteria)]